MLGELAECGLDLASPTDPSTSTYRVKVDSQLPGGVKHRGVVGYVAPVARGREDHKVVVSRGVHRVLVRPVGDGDHRGVHG